ncbi:MAG: hypothetical protein CVU05_00270 [Bacteroidetes bacterium HGW-Bacteroidetes-21]|jgi:effector-binding domain-containing protein|nr:MAG: hypothetical protein CVU05_00270 [Bacteroidetes bacterium HGW-Bacteroidetes-21]
MKSLKWIMIILISIIAIALIIAAFLPSSYKVERKTEINASFEKIAPLITDLKMWDKWSPWKAADSAAIYTYNDTIGVNAEMSWEGEIVGSGKLRITGINDTLIKYQLTFLDPMESTSEGGFIVKINDDKTELTWYDEGSLSYPMGRLMTLFISFDKMLGSDFEKGLANIKTVAEEKSYEYSYSIFEKSVDALNIAAIRDTISMNETSEVLGKNFGEIMSLLKKQKVECAGAPMAISYAWDPSSWDFEAAIPVSKEIKPEGRIQFKQSYAGKVVYIIYTGPYEGTEKAYNDLDYYMKENGYEQNGGPWEIYVTDPMTEPDTSKWITEIYFPVK